MLKKLNKKGFTLVELLATIALLALISTITIVSVVSYYEKSKEKANEAFRKQLEGYVDDYISLYSRDLIFPENGEIKMKCYTSNDSEICEEVTRYENASVKISNVITTIVNEDVMNPSTSIKCTDDNVSLKIYRDTDYVYCFDIVPKEGTKSCVDNTLTTCGFYK